MAITPITQKVSHFPAPPNSATDTPQEFNTKANDFVDHQANIYPDEVNVLADQMNNTANEIDQVVATLPAGTINDGNVSTTSAYSSSKSVSSFASKGFEGRAKTWTDVGLADADFAGLDIAGALTHIVSVMENGQEIENRMIGGSNKPNFVSIFPETTEYNITIVKTADDSIYFKYVHYHPDTPKVGHRVFHNWANSLIDSGYVELMNKEDGLSVPQPTANGDYKLHISGGNATWVSI